MEGLLQNMFNKVEASKSEVNDAPSIRRRTVEGNLRADKMMQEMKRSTDTMRLMQMDSDFQVAANDKPMAVPMDRREIAERRVNRMFDRAAQPRRNPIQPIQKPMAVRTS